MYGGSPVLHIKSLNSQFDVLYLPHHAHLNTGTDLPEWHITVDTSL